MARTPPQVLGEFWMPIAQVGAESMRDASAAQKPPLNRLHVWWARRPLTVSRAAILASVLPVWRADWPQNLRDRFPTKESYEEWFLQILGILKDPTVGRRLLQQAALRGKPIPNPYGYPRAFTRNPEPDELEALGELLEYAWGTRDLTVLDPMAGGGSIPFEALRYGFRTMANELNPVAALILKATLDYPARFGPALAEDIEAWGGKLAERVKTRLAPFFPKKEGESIHAYLWARTVACPTTGKPVPLSPNWWLQKGSNPVAVRLIADPRADECRFEIVSGPKVREADPDRGTVRDGVGRSPWTGDAIPEDYIKAEAQAGRMGQQLYAVAVKTPQGFRFRAPTEADLAAVRAAERELARRLPEWEAKGLVPRERYPEQSTDPRPLHYGMPTWADMFSPRQLLSLLTIVEELQALGAEIERALDRERAAAVRTYLALAADKAADYNSRMTRWHSGRQVLAGTFDRHDFSFKWSHGEFDAAGNLVPWVVDQVVDAYKGIASLLHGEIDNPATPRRVFRLESITKGNAASLSHIPTGSVHAVVVDPPYFANVMYAELSDFFYVWLKRTIGDLFPDWFKDELTNKDDEAVANEARFKGLKNRSELAKTDYERKLAACFREMYRVLHPDGVLTVMFTHREVSAWDTLAAALIEAGFVIQASWPVHTESEHSLHQAKKNAARSTIILVCRKRGSEGEPKWWDDLKAEVRRVAREKAREFHAQGISGADLYISVFGPVLSIISQNWPVFSSETDEKGQPIPLRPDAALELAREEVIALRREELLYGRKVQFDPITDWYLIAWDAFKAEEFPADEARKLAIALGLSLEEDVVRRKAIVTKKGSNVVFQLPRARRKKGAVDPEANTFDCLLDAMHTAMLVYEEDGSRACREFLERTGLLKAPSFKLLLQALLRVIPRTRGKDGAFLRPEAKTLDDLRLAFFDDVEAPPDEEEPKVEQRPISWAGFSEEEEEAYEEEPEEA